MKPHTVSRLVRRSIVLASLVALALPAAARASSFSLNPMLISLSPSATSVILTVKNETDQELRLQLTVFGWSQTEAGEMTLSPTDDILLFPNLVTLKGGEERRIRVGTSAAFGDTERPYRLFIEELPSAAAQPASSMVTMRTKIGIPVFMEATRAAGAAELQDLTVSGGRASMRLRNTGNVHVIVDRATFRGLDATGQTVFEQTQNGWYVLPGESRVFEQALGADCGKAATIVGEVAGHGKVLNIEAALTAGACR